VRHRHRGAIQQHSLQGISKPAIRRLARRAGVKRISEGIYQEAPEALKRWLRMMLHDASVYADHAKRFTITTNDVLLALKKNGVTLYGYAYTEKRERLTKKIDKSSLQNAAARVSAASTPPRVHVEVEEHVTPEQQQEHAVEVVEVVEATQTKKKTKKAVAASKGRVGKKNTPDSSTRRNNMAPRTPQDGPHDGAAAPSVTPERAQEIQVSLSSFRDTVIARQASSDAPVPKVIEWVSAHMLGRGKTACTPAEMDIVLEALCEKDALMITDDDAHNYKTVWFI